MALEIDEQELRRLIREEARNLIRDELTVQIRNYHDYYTTGLKIELCLESDVIYTDTVTLSTDN